MKASDLELSVTVTKLQLLPPVTRVVFFLFQHNSDYIFKSKAYNS